MPTWRPWHSFRSEVAAVKRHGITGCGVDRMGTRWGTIPLRYRDQDVVEAANNELDHGQPQQSPTIERAAMTNGMMPDHSTPFIRDSVAPIITDVTPILQYSGPSACHLPCFHLVRTDVVNSQIKSREHDFCFNNRGRISKVASVVPPADGVVHVAACLTGTWVDRNISLETVHPNSWNLNR